MGNSEANTPLTAEEQEELIPNLATRAELNEWERENILRARLWALGKRRLRLRDPVTEPYVRELHRGMFHATWKWAGRYRRTEKNLGVAPQLILEGLAALLGDAAYWIEHGTYSVDEIAIRFHHRLVVIHPFPNGNGRHARLIADVLAARMGRPVFSWGGGRELADAGSVREAYLRALRSADGGNCQPLLEFSRS